MKNLFLIILVLLLSPLFSFASSLNGTILTPYAWGDKVGWVNFKSDNSIIHITSSSLSGYAWDPVYGWLNLSPDNGGVKNDGQGNLSGNAWSQNGGWVDFSGVKINSSGKFTGTATGSTYGNISFDCDNCNVTTDWRIASSPNSPTPQVTNTASKGRPATVANSATAGSSNKATVISNPKLVASTIVQISNIKKDLKVGSKNNDVKTLQQFLIDQNKGLKAKALKKNGVTNYFGNGTKQALIEWQKANKISVTGVLDSKTKNKIKKILK